uniref:hypothetical protein n=1 Tax=Gelidibacter sp. TaxID=2018083 RepID=UPI00404B6F18
MAKQHWKSEQQIVLPDFIIGGAMKSGATTLYAILNEQPDVTITNNELGFFDMDDITIDPDFNFYDSKRKIWSAQSMSEFPELIWNWYHSQFTNDIKKTKIVEKDSTTYMASSFAAK